MPCFDRTAATAYRPRHSSAQWVRFRATDSVVVDRVFGPSLCPLVWGDVGLSRIAPDLLRVGPDGVLLSLRVTPKSSRDEVVGLIERGGSTQLAVKVRAAPQDGAANDAVLKLISAAFGCKTSAVSIAAGAKDRDKTVLISGAQFDAAEAWLNSLGPHG